MRTMLHVALASGLLAVGLQAASVCTPGPGVWNEGDGGQGDAGKKPDTANITVGADPLNYICGNLVDATSGGDMYAISIEGSTFTAIATGLKNNGIADPNLFLFDSTGHGLDAAYSSSGTAELDLSGLTPGIYYIALAGDGQDPENGSGNSIFNGNTTPVLNYGHSHLRQWSDTGNPDDSGRYSIALSDAGFSNLPEPGSFALLGAGLGALGWIRRRR
jgi:hypothetical protein